MLVCKEQIQILVLDVIRLDSIFNEGSSFMSTPVTPPPKMLQTVVQNTITVFCC